MKKTSTLVALVLFLLVATYQNIQGQCSISSNVVSNSNFSSGNTGFTSSYSYSSGNLVPEGTYDVITNPHSSHSGFSSCGDHTSGSGKMLVVNGSTTAGVSVWCQTVTVTANTAYTFSAWLASVNSNNPAILQFSINGVNLGSTFTASSTTCSWQQFCETWNSGASTSASICIVNQNTTANGNDFALDDIQMGPTAVLPIKLTSFTASNFQGGTLLKWTAEESQQDLDYYRVEKSSDLSHWEEVEKISPKFNHGHSTYEIVDIHTQNAHQNLYYRIKSIYQSGYYENSTTVAVSLTEQEFSICPNPTFDHVFVFGPQGVMNIQILNSLEHEVKRYTFNEHANPIELDVSTLGSGIYFVKVFTSSKEYVFRLVKR